jgi:hypothetical protein
MMLADHLLQQAGTPVDMGGMIGGIASKIKQAQRFVMGRDAAEACLELLHARPSTMIKALPLCRLPYDTMWVETAGGFAADMPAREGAPVPSTQGTLIEGRGDQRGVMTVAWVHPPRTNVEGLPPDYYCNASPYSLWFDFAEDGDAAALVREHHQKLLATAKSGLPHDLIKQVLDRIETKFRLPATTEQIREFMRERSWWARWANDPREIEALHQHDRHMQVGLSPHGLGAVLTAMDLAVAMKEPKMFSVMMQSWETDIVGEGPFGQFFITLLNSKNAMTQQPVSMAKLNKARAKRSGNKPALLDYTTVNLTMSRSRARAGQASGMSHESMRRHMVRGHFKIRKTGVYWWTPFPRGDASKPSVQRQRYEVTA